MNLNNTLCIWPKNDLELKEMNNNVQICLLVSVSLYKNQIWAFNIPVPYWLQKLPKNCQGTFNELLMSSQ